MSESPVCREGDNLLCGRRVAIVFVPGVMGTRIKIGTGDVAWDADSTTNLIGWAWMNPTAKIKALTFETTGTPFTEFHRGTGEKLQDWSDSVDAAMLPDWWIFGSPATKVKTKAELTKARAERGWAGLRGASYGLILKTLEQWSWGANKTPVYAYGYDWRCGVLGLGVQMAADLLGKPQSGWGITRQPNLRYGGKALLDHATPAGAPKCPCVFITHSMGGLVTRAALKCSAELRERTKGVLHGVQPVLGASVFYRRLSAGVFSPVDGGMFSVEGNVFRAILAGGSGAAENMAGIASILPGAVQLLPSPRLQERLGPWLGLASWTTIENRATVHYYKGDVYALYRSDEGHPKLSGPASTPEAQRPPGIMRTTLPATVRTKLLNRLTELKFYYDSIGDYLFPGKTWAFYGDECDTDSTAHFNLPPKEYVKEVIVIPRGGAATVFRAVGPGGETVYLSETDDLKRRGYTREVPGAAKGVSAGFGPHGDGTVPRLSASALFPTQTTDADAEESDQSYDFGFRQFRFPGLEHEPAYGKKYPGVHTLVLRWLEHVLTK